MITLIKKKGINPNTKEVLYYPQWTRQNTVSEKELAKRMTAEAEFKFTERPTAEGEQDVATDDSEEEETETEPEPTPEPEPEEDEGGLAG